MPERARSRKPMKILVTGVAGFIGMHCARRLLQRGDTVTGIDNLNDYYEVCLKKDRLNRLVRRYRDTGRFATHRMSIENRDALRRVFDEERPRRVIHLAAQVGVRNSVANPHDYIDTNIKGFMNVLECCADHRVEHLVYASSSSVYGVNESLPYSEDNRADHPKSIYGATKKANELMAHAYSDLHALPTTGLRFFTVYGPWGRPDMALFKFARAIMEGRAIDVYDGENMVRDFTYIDDIVEGVIRVMDKSPTQGDAPESSGAAAGRAGTPCRVFNIGKGRRTGLMDYIAALERELGVKAKINRMPRQPGDVRATEADTSHLEKWVGFRPDTGVDEGVRKFVRWFRTYHRLQRARNDKPGKGGL